LFLQFIVKGERDPLFPFLLKVLLLNIDLSSFLIFDMILNLKKNSHLFEDDYDNHLF